MTGIIDIKVGLSRHNRIDQRSSLRIKKTLKFRSCSLAVRICTHILAFEGDSKVFWFEGSYSEYEANKKMRLGDDATEPKRIRYRKLE